MQKPNMIFRGNSNQLTDNTILVKGRVFYYTLFLDEFYCVITKVHKKNGTGPIVSIAFKKLNGLSVPRSTKHKKWEFWREYSHFKDEYKNGQWIVTDMIMPLDSNCGKLLYLENKK